MADNDTVDLPLADGVPLAGFLANRTRLTIPERLIIVCQAIGALDNIYVHLPVKQYLYGIDPIGRLRALEARLGSSLASADDDLPFHRELVDILSECRDMHTGYYLPDPFRRSVAFLPFQIEEYYDGVTRRYIVPRIFRGGPEMRAATDFKRGVEILAWNGMPTESAVMAESERSPGINSWARHARGLYRLTTRPLAKCPPPDKDRVAVTYRTLDGHKRTTDVLWRVVQLPGALQSLPEGVPIGGNQRKTIDFETEVFRAVKQTLSSQHHDAAIADALAKVVEPSLPTTNLEVSARACNGRQYGYVRIHSFGFNDPHAALASFKEQIHKLPTTNGLIIDVRDNPGGSIEAAELMLQALAGKRLDRAPLMFRNTPFIQKLGHLLPDDFGRWTPALEAAQKAGAVFSEGVPLWPDSEYPETARIYPGPAVLIVNALSYSATDFFAAGFQDHDIGPILGIHASTGGGGANVEILGSLTGPIALLAAKFAGLWMPVSLPAGADLHVALRRSVRTGRNAGLQVEDLGVAPNAAIYRMSKRDVLEGNPDLFEAAVSLL